MTVRGTDLEADLWSPIVALDRDVLTDAWRQTHHAAQAVVEVGKRWGDERPDDSHSAMLFDPEDETWCSLVGEALGPVRGRLDIGSGVITVDRDEPNEGAWLDPTGRTPNSLAEWVNTTAERLIGQPPRRESKPAPDLPEHPVGEGRPFDLEDTQTLADLDTLYAFTAHMLLRFGEIARALTIDGDHDLTPRLWPHHFDLASLVVLGRDRDGAMTKTIGVGLSPPDGIDASGYWYVSPWQRDPPAGAQENETLVPLERGRWVDRGGSSMAVLPVSTLAKLEEPGAQSSLVAGFVANAFTISAERLRDNAIE